jgi:hypothetical protein
VLSVDHDRRRIGLSMAASAGGTDADVAAVTKAHAPTRLGTFADLLKKSSPLRPLAHHIR